MSFPTGSEGFPKLQTLQPYYRLHHHTEEASSAPEQSLASASEQAYNFDLGHPIIPPVSLYARAAYSNLHTTSLPQPAQASSEQLPAELIPSPSTMAREEESEDPSESGDDPPGGVSLEEFEGDEMELDEEPDWPANSPSLAPEYHSTLQIPPAVQSNLHSIPIHQGDYVSGPAHEPHGLGSSMNEAHADIVYAELDGDHEDHDEISAEAIASGFILHDQSMPSFPLSTTPEGVASVQAPSPQQGSPHISPSTPIPSISTILFQAGLHLPDVNPTIPPDPEPAGNGLANSQASSQNDDLPPLQWTTQQNQIALSQVVPVSLVNNLLTDLYAWAEDETRNFDVCKFFDYWEDVSSKQPRDYPFDQLDYFQPITDETLQVLHRQTLTKVFRDDLDYNHCDFQGLDWSALGVRREAARDVRKKTYVNHTNVLLHRGHRRRRHEPLFGSSSYMNTRGRSFARPLSKGDNHFRFRQMSMRYKVSQNHFQLRHMISASSKNSLFYAGWQEVYCVNPVLDYEKCVLDLSKPLSNTDVPILGKVSAVTATDGVLLAGGFQGEYAMKSLSASYDEAYTPGTIPLRDENGSTNHIHTFLGRRSGLPQAVFSSNDDRVRILDCYTNRIIHEHDFGWAVNCSATSPDTRLRLIIGDSCHPWVVNAETGERVVRLPNHKDFGFACAWSPDGRNVATGNQDGTVQIFDVRSFREPLESHILATEIGGVRCMAFSPVGSGRRVLVLGESADFVHVVDATTLESEQRFDFFGEIGGLSFMPDGGSFWVANTDHVFGGLVEFERAGVRGGFGRGTVRELVVRGHNESEHEWEEMLPNDWMSDEDMDGDARVLVQGTQRRRRGLGLADLIL